MKNYKVLVDSEILENVIKYCEDYSLYDKLSKYGDFYYKLNRIVRKYIPGDTVYILSGGSIEKTTVVNVYKVSDGYSYELLNCERYNVDDIFSSVEELLESLKRNIVDNTNKITDI